MIQLRMVVLGFLLGIVFVHAASLVAAETNACWPFFAFDNGLHGIADPPKVLKELGYAGISAHGWEVAELVKQYQAAGLKVVSTYVPCYLDKTPPYDPKFNEAIQQLRGSGVVVWLTVLGGKYGKEDEKAAAIVRQIADGAGSCGLRVALYPHTGFYVATTADALRLLRRIERPNVGVSINLCHELMTDQESKLDDTIRQAAPHLFLVSINGADAKRPGYGWDRLIQPLGRGDFDVCAFLGKLKHAGYHGPIGLQCYGVKGDTAKNLKESMDAWRDYQRRLECGAR